MRGSPRELLSSGEKKQIPTKVLCRFVLKYSEKFQEVKDLVPDSIFLGSNDLLPGVVNSILPNDEKDTNIDLQMSSSVYIQKLKIYMRKEVEEEIINQIQSYLTVTDQNQNL